MKIAFAYESAYPWFNGGVEKRRYNILEELAKNKENSIYLFTLYRPGMPGKSFVYRGINYRCVGKAKDINKMYVGARRSIVMSLKFSMLLFFYMLRYRFDLIDTDAFPFLHVPLLWAYAKLTGAKLVVTWHEVWSKEFWQSYLPKGAGIGYFFEKLSAILPEALLANSSMTKERLTSILKVKDKPVIVFPAAINKDEIREFEESKTKCSKENKFVVVSRLVKHKRVELAIRAIKEANEKADVRLVVVGKGPELEPLKKLAKELKIDKKVEFKHDLGIEELYKELCTSKGLLMPSEREGLSLVTAEALVLGVPVLIVNTTMLPQELRKFCIEVKEEEYGNLIADVATNYKGYEQKYKAIKEKAMKELSGEGAEEVYAKLIRLS